MSANNGLKIPILNDLAISWRDIFLKKTIKIFKKCIYM
ncbi:hypothetical protein B4098_3365 [Heyndrickxia coagulans]|uniref:Uncharacterized protein n=1 Tax=Heyndrickxia coagulans TaxID=1398 RepID=A0A150K5C0_HEYCO|nr:hypothetical protein B4098_3365 [Heyndrickxia coagulans]